MPLKCKVCEHVFDDFDACPKCGSEEMDRLARRGPAAFIVVTLLGVMLAAILVPNFIRAKARGRLTSCKSNLKTIATGLEMYATDNQGVYPPNFDLLTPDYLRVIPTCPGAGVDTYSLDYRVHHQPEGYTFYCSGLNHESASVARNYPQYNSTQGLIERP